MRIDGLGLGDIAQGHPVARMPLLLEDVEGENGVVRRDGGAIGKACFGSQAEGHRLAVGGHVRCLRNEAIGRVGFVRSPHHEAVIDEPQALGGIALQNEAVEAVEGLQRRRADGDDASALGGGWVDVLEVLEIGRILEVAERGQAVPWFRGRLAGRQQQHGQESDAQVSGRSLD